MYCSLKLTPTPRTKRTRQRTTEVIESDSAKKKKRRVEHDDVTSANVSTSASGFIQIVDVDHKGNFVQIKNMSDQVGISRYCSIVITYFHQTESIGGYRIHHRIEDQAEIVFKFHSKSRLQGGHSVTVSFTVVHVCKVTKHDACQLVHTYDFCIKIFWLMVYNWICC